MTVIVAGVDGSPEAQEALRWAVQEARLRGAGMRVVHAWAFPFTETEIAVLAGAAAHEPVERAAHVVLDRALRDVDIDGVPLETVVRQGPPAKVLLDAAGDAAMLVVGCRGRGGFAGLVLGSVSQHCVAHAHCPVVVVRGPARPAPG